MLEILERARKFLTDPDNWIKGAPADDHGRRCLINALPDGGDDWCDAAALLDELAEKLHPVRSHSGVHRAAANFNDHPSTTHAEVLAFLDEVILVAKNQDIRPGLTE